MLSVWREYQQSFTFPFGIRAKGRPHGYIVAVLFDSERDGLLFPSRLDLTDFTWMATMRADQGARLVSEILRFLDGA